ncbi:MAG: ABC transporter permease [Verrucomicrobia bacterium]|nr:ABC transporter permease [Verrucomicrobiota bacterium]
MLRLALRNLVRRPVRTGLALLGLAMAVAVLACLSAFGTGYRRALHQEIDRMGVQLMLVPIGCPYDAAARVLKGNALEHSLPQSALAAVRDDSAVAVAAPLLIVAAPRPAEKRADLWVGLDASARELKPWWRVQAGAAWFPDANSVILGAEAAIVEMRAPGDKLFCPEVFPELRSGVSAEHRALGPGIQERRRSAETPLRDSEIGPPEMGRTFRVAGVLERSGTSDDNLFFVPLATAQEMFHQPSRLTAIAIRLRDPTLAPEATERLQAIPGAQVVTLTEMIGTFLNLVGSVRTLVQAIASLAIAVSGLGLFNTLLATVLNRAAEFAVLRAVGASRAQVFVLITVESLLLAGVGSGLGLALALGTGGLLESAVKRFVPFAPLESLVALTWPVVFQCLALGAVVGLAAGLYPAWQASRAQPATALKLTT